MKRGIKDYGILLLKGMSMGAADVVPGVSGGTIAFIVGIYDELINSIRNVNPQNLKLLLKGKFASFWEAVNANFLLSVICGIAISVFSLAKLITWLLATHPILVWSFFFGLVLSSTWFVAQDIRQWNWKTVTAFIAGIGIAYYITVATPAQTPNGLPFIFLCGAIAICAMILPGISGSFILVLLGKYFYIMEAVKNLDFVILGVFLLGAVLGITSFSHILSYALRKFRAVTLAVLTGFMLGSLNKVWPWKEIHTETINGQAFSVERNIAPDQFLWQALVLMAAGFLIVFILEKISSRSSSEADKKD